MTRIIVSVGCRIPTLREVMAKLTKRLIDSLKPGGKDLLVWDQDLKGFGVRVKPSGRKSFIIQYRNAQGRSRRLTVGVYGRLTPAEARKEARQMLAAVDRGRDPAETRAEGKKAPTMAELAERYMEEHAKPKKKPLSVIKDRQLLDIHILPALGKYKVQAVTKRDVAKLHHSMRDTPIQANRALALLSKMFNISEAWGLRPDYSNPCRHVQKFKERSRERFLSSEELSRVGGVLKKAESKEMPGVITAIRLLLLTGARVNEILTLQWNHVDFDNRCLRLPDSKAGSKVIPLGGPALEVLRTAERQQGNPFVCPGQKPGRHLVGIRKAWHRLRSEARLDDVRLHDLRHSFASVAASSGLGLPIIGGLLGHADQATTQRYAHLQVSVMNEAADRVASLISEDLKKTPRPKVVNFLRDK